MDILISSNLERLIYDLYDKDDKKIAELMNELSVNGKYTVDTSVLDKMSNLFVGGCCDDNSTKNTIADTFKKYNYLCDTHTAVAVNVYNNYYNSTNDTTKTVIVSTASPYKFSEDVLKAIVPEFKANDEFEVIDILEKETNTKAPAQLKNLKNKEVRFKNICDKNDMQNKVLSNLNIK